MLTEDSQVGAIASRGMYGLPAPLQSRHVGSSCLWSDESLGVVFIPIFFSALILEWGLSSALPELLVVDDFMNGWGSESED